MNTTVKNPAAKGSQTPAVKAKTSGLGLDSMGDLSALLDAPLAAQGQGGPMELSLSVIDEDEHQPRTADNPGFSADSIAEIGATIKDRGVKSPISVRENQAVPGRFIINHGARRFRGSVWAGKTTIPAFVDNDYNDADQVIENLQRNELTPREIADFVGRELAKGKKKSEIAKEIGKSAAFITQHVTLLDLPESVARVFNSGRVKDVTVVNELVTAHKKNPDEVRDWLADDDQELTRGSVKLFREFLDGRGEAGGGDGSSDGAGSTGGDPQEEGKGGDSKKVKGKGESDPEKLKKAIVQVMHDGRPARIVLSRRPAADGLAWLKYEDDGHEFEAELSSVTLVALLEG